MAGVPETCWNDGSEGLEGWSFDTPERSTRRGLDTLLAIQQFETELYERLSPSAVQIQMINPNKLDYDPQTDKFAPELMGSGSGAIIYSEPGKLRIITARHVIDNKINTKEGYQPSQLAISLSKSVQGGDTVAFSSTKVIYKSSEHDFAIVEATYDPSLHQLTIPAAQLGDSDTLAPGSKLYIFAGPNGLQDTMIESKVTAPLRQIPTYPLGSGKTDTLHQIFYSQPGMSGGMVVDLKGEIVGFANAIIQGDRATAFMLPVNAIKEEIAPFLPDLSEEEQERLVN